MSASPGRISESWTTWVGNAAASIRSTSGRRICGRTRSARARYTAAALSCNPELLEGVSCKSVRSHNTVAAMMISDR
jgi:hypothetical protein